MAQRVALRQPAGFEVGTRRRRDGRTYLLLTAIVLLLVSLLAWRSGTYYSGGIDPVIAGKAALNLIALFIGVYLLRTADERAWVGLRTIAVTSAYLAVTVIGGLAGGSAVPDLVLAIRAALVLATMACLVMAVPLDELISSVLTALAFVGLVLAVTGISSYLADGRLSGGLLPVNPNQVALLLGPPALGCLWRMLNQRAGVRDPLWFLGLLALDWMTGSRAGLVAMLVAVVIVTVMAPRVHVATFVTLVLGVPICFFVVYLTPVVSSYFNRDGTGNVATLNSRTIAWQAAFSAPRDFWGHWFGGGLGVKTVAVSGTYWDTQVLDSSWVSTYVQAGLLGLILLGLWVVLAAVGAARMPKPYRALMLALVVYAVIRSVLETGLLDSYVLFVVMLFPALAAEREDRAPPLQKLTSARRVASRGPYPIRYKDP